MIVRRIPVSVQQAAFKGSAQAVGEYDLKNISFPDMMFGFFHHGAELFSVEQRSYFTQQAAAGFLFFLTCPDEFLEPSELQHRLVISDLDVVERHIHDEDQLLAKIIESDDFVEQHQIHIFEILRIFRAAADSRFSVSQVFVREIACETSCKRGEIIKAGAFIISENLTEIFGGIFGSEPETSDLHLAVSACDFQLRVRSRETYSVPIFCRPMRIPA